MMRLREKIADGPVLSLIESFLQASILDGLEGWNPTAGAPQGAVLSPLLSNIYLDPLDHLMARAGFAMVRYADDCAPRRCERTTFRNVLERHAA
jgi:RNA-directed DNA polymerase